MIANIVLLPKQLHERQNPMLRLTVFSILTLAAISSAAEPSVPASAKSVDKAEVKVACCNFGNYRPNDPRPKTQGTG